VYHHPELARLSGNPNPLAFPLAQLQFEAFGPAKTSYPGGVISFHATVLVAPPVILGLSDHRIFMHFDHPGASPKQIQGSSQPRLTPSLIYAANLQE
jgi:hypothetical protein